MPVYGGGPTTSTGVLNVFPTSIPSQPGIAMPPAALNIRGFSGQTEASDLLLALTYEGDGFARINWDGSIQIAADSDNAQHLLEVGDTTDNLVIVSSTGNEAVVTIQGRANVTALDVRGIAGQTEPLVYTATPSGGVLQVKPAGAIIFKASVPADADVPTGHCALWFDSTNGAAKLMIKAKQNDGTVRTGSVALT